jgi:hypothetical protein
MEPGSQIAALRALGGTGGCEPSNIRATVPVIFGGTGGCEPSIISANAPLILGGTGGCEPSRNAALGGTAGWDPLNIALKVLCDDELAGATLATRPKTTYMNTTALAVRFIAISCFFLLGRV